MKRGINRRKFLKLTGLTGLGFSIFGTKSLAGLENQISNKDIKVVLWGLEDIKSEIRKKARDETGCHLFGNYLNNLENKVIPDMKKNARSELNFRVPDNFLVDEMDFSIKVLKEKIPKIKVYQNYNLEKLLLFNNKCCLGRNTKTKRKRHSTPSGKFYLQRVVHMPRWFPNENAKQKKPSDPGPKNPFGLWMSELSTVDKPGDYEFKVEGDTLIRIHSTNDPKSIGQYKSKGCIRLDPNVAEELFCAILHYSKHGEGKKRFRGIIHPLEKAIPISIS